MTNDNTTKKTTRKTNDQLYRELERKLEHATQHAPLEKLEKRHSKKMLSARERINHLLDKDTFREIDALMTHRCIDFGMDEKKIPGDGVVTGWGTIHGRKVFVFSQDFMDHGGTLGETFAKKMLKVMELAVKARCPIIGLNDSGGARIQEGVLALGGYGEVFRMNTLASGYIPQISAIMGPCAGGAVYSPAITDFVFMVRDTSHMFITGPAVIKTVTGEEIDFHNLGGARAHGRRSGVCHFESKNEIECLEGIRKLLSYIPNNCDEKTPREKPHRAPENNHGRDLRDAIPEDDRGVYDMRQLLRLLVDENTWFEVHKGWAKNFTTGFARIEGRSVGILGNNPMFYAGCLDINASDKAARFVRFCDCFNIPMITLVDVPGFLPGSTQEHNGIIRHGAKLLFAYSEATVPMITVIVRKAYGGAYDAMCSKHIGCDINFAWPTAQIAVMGADGAANIIFRREIQEAENPQQRRQELVNDYTETFANPYKAAEHGFIDAVILPEETRTRLIDALEMLSQKNVPRLKKKHGNIPL